MSVEGLFRLHLGGLFWTSVVFLFVWVVLGFVAKQSNYREDRDSAGLFHLRRLILGLAIILAGVWLVDGLITNATPRAVIDRSGVNQQQEEREKRQRHEAQDAHEKSQAPKEESR